jgi:hypothetical protein
VLTGPKDKIGTCCESVGPLDSVALRTNVLTGPKHTKGTCYMSRWPLDYVAYRKNVFLGAMFFLVVLHIALNVCPGPKVNMMLTGSSKDHVVENLGMTHPFDRQNLKVTRSRAQRPRWLHDGFEIT